MFNKLTNKQLFSKFLVTRFDIYVDLKHTGCPKKVTCRMMLKPKVLIKYSAAGPNFPMDVTSVFWCFQVYSYIGGILLCMSASLVLLLLSVSTTNLFQMMTCCTNCHRLSCSRLRVDCRCFEEAFPS